MRERTYFLPVFLVCLGLVFLIFFLGTSGLSGTFTGSIQSALFPLGGFIHSQAVPKTATQLDLLQKENRALSQQLVALQNLSADNIALRDQFQTVSPASQNLLPSRVVGVSGAIPNISFPEELIISGGTKEGVVVGAVIVVDNEIIGTVHTLSLHYSDVFLVTNKNSSFSVKDAATNAIGVAKGSGSGELEMDNVLLSDTLHVGDIVESLGSQAVTGDGLPPDMVVGKIVSIEKNPSSLFQIARLVPLVAFDRLMEVFILK